MSALGSIGEAMKELSPKNAITNAQQMFNRKCFNQVVIHVCDESKKKTLDFKCEKGLLLQHMKYFDKYLAD